MENQDVVEQVSQEAQEQPQTPIPEVCRYSVLHGKSGKPLYFEHEDGRCFDCDSESWMDKKPAVAKELSSRPITVNDFLYAILHGLVDRPTYDTLSQKGLVSEESKRAFEKLEKISNDLQHASMLAKSEDSVDGLDVPEDYFDEPLQENAGEDFDEESFEDFSDVEEQGTDVVAEIFALASKYSVDPNLEDIIRQIVREELSGQKPVVEEFTDEQRV